MDLGLFNTSAGLLSESIMRLPNRRFMPDTLHQTVVTGKHLRIMGCRQDEIKGSSIALDPRQSLLGAMGEFVERYASSLYDENRFTVGTWRQLSQEHKILPLDDFRFYSGEQYEAFKPLNVCPLGPDDMVEWTEAFDLISRRVHLVPAFCVYLPFQSRMESSHTYLVGETTTGIAAGQTIEDAVRSGFCECAERHAFARFWYCQERDIKYAQYTRETILKAFGSDPVIKQLFSNRRVLLKVFDLSPFAPLETMVVFLFFDYKGFRYQSLGCAARFDKRSALLKACLEAYQGIEYAINLMDKHPRQAEEGEPDLSAVNSFDAHFHFYNRYPEYRACSPILRQAADAATGDSEIFHQDEEKICHGLTAEELEKSGLRHLLFTDITPMDVHQSGYRVARVLTPGWSLLTGIHAFPFLGQELDGLPDLFTRYPHPFP